MSDEVYLQHIRDAASEILEFVAGGRDDFFARRIVQAAVICNLEVVGEAVKRLSGEYRAAHPQLPWREIAGMRDMLIHAYHRVELDIVWDTVENDIPKLLAVVGTKQSE